MYNFKNSQ